MTLHYNGEMPRSQTSGTHRAIALALLVGQLTVCFEVSTLCVPRSVQPIGGCGFCQLDSTNAQGSCGD